jgi:tRNA dimethylallyltransferase
VAEWLELARAEYELAELPIFVGGSGMYVSALTSGLSPIPEISAENRRRAREMVEKTPAAAKALTDFEFKDPNRTARALEVFLETGRPISEWQALPRRGAITPAPIRILISPPKDLLDERIAARVREMLDTGGLEEARTHMDYPDRAIGIEEIGRHLRGEISLQWALENLAARTSQYAKRQRTWFRSQFDENILFPHVPMDADLEKLLTIK